MQWPEPKKHETRFGIVDPAEPVADAAKWGEVIILSSSAITTLDECYRRN